jgi:sec-independent protein translocase protein TatA
MFEGLFMPSHLLLVLAIALIVFGPGKLPELGKALGDSIRELKKALHEGTAHRVADSSQEKSADPTLGSPRSTNSDLTT